MAIPNSSTLTPAPPYQTPQQLDAIRAGIAKYNATGSFNGQTPDQNLAAVYQGGIDPNKPVIPTPYMQGVLGRSASDTARGTAAPAPTDGGFIDIGKLGSGQKTDTIATPSTDGQKPPSNILTNAPKTDYAGIAASRIAQQRLALQGSVNAYDASRKSAFDYAQGTTQGNRALLQFDNSNRGDQFGGSAREDLFRLQRSQGIEDTAANTQYQNDISASDAKLAAFDAGSAGLQQDIQSQLEHQNFTDTLALNQDTRAQSAQDYSQSPTNPSNIGQTLSNQGQTITNNLNSLKLADYPAQSQAAAAKVQQDLKTGAIDQEAAAFKLNELKDPNSPTNQAAALDLQLKKMDVANAPQEQQLKIQQLQKQINQIGAAPYKSADEKAYDAQKVVEIKANIDKIKADTLKAGTTKPEAVVDSKTSTDNHATISEDLKSAANAAEANALIEANRNNLTDADYKDLKKKVIDQF